MRRTSKADSRRRRLPRLVPYRPMIELLEDRLPPGDVLLGHGLVSSWLGQDVAVLGANPRTATTSQAEIRFGPVPAAQFNAFVVPQGNRSSSAVLFAAGLPGLEQR